MTLGDLTRKLDGITFGDLSEGGDMFVYLQRFFSGKEIQEQLVYLNQVQNAEKNIWRDGYGKPPYAQFTLEKRRVLNYKPQSTQWSGHEEGDLFRSMAVLVDNEGFAIISSPTDGLDLDFFGGNGGEIDYEHIESYFATYDQERRTLGITDESMDAMREPMMESVLNQLKNYING